jgi:hypothetical protein
MAFVVAIVFSLALRVTTVHAFDDPCAGSNHGEFTSVLCPGDGMTGEGAYITSDSTYYRLYISAGTLAIYQNDGQHDTTNTWDLYNGSNGNVYQMVFVTVPFVGIELYGYDRDQNLVFTSNSAAGQSYFKLDNDGCLRGYYRNSGILNFEQCS